MKRVFLLAMLVACGGRTTLGDDDLGNDAALVDGSIGSDGNVAKDGGVIAPDSGVVIVDASLPPSDSGVTILDGGGVGTIPCGNTTCNASTETCCVMFNGKTTSESCTPQGQCQGAALDCTSAANCPPNEVCCATLMQQSVSASCASQCQGGFQNPQLCAQDSECPQGQTCKNGPFGFKVCRP